GLQFTRSHPCQLGVCRSYAATPSPAASTASRPHASSPGSTCHTCTTRHRPPRHTLRPHGPAYSRRLPTSEGTHAGSTEDTTGLQTKKKRGSAEPATPPHSPSPHQPSKPPPDACGQPPNQSQQPDQHPHRSRTQRPPTDHILGDTLPARAKPERRT